jgi:hypothetical protein
VLGLVHSDVGGRVRGGVGDPESELRGDSMTVAVTRSAEQAVAGLRVHVGPRPEAGVLVHEVHLAAGVQGSI